MFNGQGFFFNGQGFFLMDKILAKPVLGIHNICKNGQGLRVLVLESHNIDEFPALQTNIKEALRSVVSSELMLGREKPTEEVASKRFDTPF